MTISGGATSTGIVVQLAPGIATFTLAGTAPITVRDAVDGNGIVGNDGNNVITVTDGVDAVNGGLGTNDRLVVDYHLAIGAVTGDSTSNFTEAPGLRSVTITAGTFEHFTILTGSGADTITTGAGDDIINAGNGANTITAGQGSSAVSTVLQVTASAVGASAVVLSTTDVVGGAALTGTVSLPGHLRVQLGAQWQADTPRSDRLPMAELQHSNPN